MSARIITLAIPLLLSGLAFGQQPAQPSKTLYFAHPTNSQITQEVTNTLRSIVEIKNITADNTAASITLSGTAAQIAEAEWLFQKLDQPAEARPASPAQYTLDGDPNPQVRVFYLTNVSVPRDIQELVNNIRAMAEIQRITAYNPLGAIVLRATPNQVGLAEWVVAKLDVRSGQAPTGPNPAGMAYQPEFIHDNGVAARIFYLTNYRQPAEMQAIINSIRSVAEIQRILPFGKDAAIVLRGSNEQAALAEWLMNLLDKPAGAQPSAALEFQLAGDRTPIVEVFHLAHIAGAQPIQDLVNSIRQATRLQRITAYNPTQTVIVRGTGAQIAQTMTVVQERDKADTSTGPK
jgi:type II secretory pathway component GspD/PulD (secretin)